MASKAQLEKLKRFKQELKRKAHIEELILFGSQVKGKTHRWSDFDLIIVSPSFIGKKFRYRSVGLRKYWNLDSPVDFICYTPEEFKKLSKEQSLVSQAIKEGIAI
jgi:predicted nucleotidyltransferase